MSDSSTPFHAADSSRFPPDEERLMKLESVVMHLQHDVEQMHEMLLAQQHEIREFRNQLKRLESRLHSAADEPPLPDPNDERPPHY